MVYRFIVSVSSPEYSKITRWMGIAVHSVSLEGSRDEPLTEAEMDEMVATYRWGEFDKLLQIQQWIDGNWRALRSVMREEALGV